MAEIVTLERQQNDIDTLIVGDSPAIRNLKQMILRIARSDVSVMITGPSGSGKEMVARAIHCNSQRNAESLVALNCGAIPAELIESELFGHEKGSFTGASSRRIGRFEEAHKGTLFLDEIGDMRFDMQVKLLRVLEDAKIHRIGSNSAIPVNVRIISATHQNIDAAISQNRFREDLYFRLGVIPICVPSLASRVEDVPLLIAHFQKGTKKSQAAAFDAGAIARLQEHSWPGNVRELRNFVDRANVLFGGATIGRRHTEQLLNLSARGPATVSEDIPASTIFDFDAAPLCSEAETARAAAPQTHEPARIADPLLHAEDQKAAPINLREMLEGMELERIHAALLSADGVISEAARLLTLKRTTLIEKMRKYGVEKLC